MQGIWQNLPRRRQNEGQRVIRDFIHAVVRNIADRDIATRRCEEVHIVHADAVTDDCLRARHGVDDIRIQPGELGDDRIRVRAKTDEFRFALALPPHDFDARRLEQCLLDAEIWKGPVRDNDP